MIRIRFFDPTTNVALGDVIPTRLEISKRLNESEDWSAEIPANVEIGPVLTNDMPVEIYWKDNLILVGSLQAFDSKSNSESSSKGVSGRGVIDDLYKVRAFSQSYFQNTLHISVLGQLLDRAGWRIGYINTLSDLDDLELMTIDVRGEKRLFSQILKTIEGVPDMFFRYGGFINGKHALDLGAFDERLNIDLYKPAAEEENAEYLTSNILAVESIAKRTSSTEVINGVEAFGGEVQDGVGVVRLISLEDALGLFPVLATDPDFPIETESTGVYIVRNAAINVNVGSQSTERFSQYAPPRTNTNSTVNDCEVAGYALYLRCVAFLKDHAGTEVLYDIVAHGDYFDIKLGDRIYVYSPVQHTIYDVFADTSETVTEVISSYLRVLSSKLTFKENSVQYNLTLTEGLGITQEDIFVSVYDVASPDDQIVGDVVVPAFPPETEEITISVENEHPDATFDDGVSAKLIFIDPPGSPPVGATDVILLGIPYGASDQGDLRIELTSDPVFIAPYRTEVKVAFKGRGWTFGDAVELKAQYLWV